MCQVEGCSSRHTEIDHREDYARTHHTRLDELEPMCRHHHRLKTMFGWALIEGTGKRAFVPPEDPCHPNRRARAPAA